MRPWRRLRSLRGRLLAAVVVSVGVALAIVLVVFNVVLREQLSHDATSVVRARASAELGTLRVVDGRLVAAEAPDDAALDSQVWVFSGAQALEHPQVAPALDRAAAALAAGPRRTVDVPGQSSRLYAVPVVRRGQRLGTVVAGVSLSAYRRTQRVALIASIVLGALVLAGVVVLAGWLLRASLRPVARMTHQAAEWSEHDLGRRFALGEPHDELTELAATLDRLLERLAASLRREQRFSAELSHELRTPLARISAEAELALRRDRDDADYRKAIEAILDNAEQMSRAVETLVAAARAEAGPQGTSNAAQVAQRAIESCAALAQQRGIDLSLDPGSADLRLAVEADLAERVLVPLVENACRYGERSVRVSIRASDGAALFDVLDDGPGVGEEERERIFEPGVRGHAAGDGQPHAGAGLGLALARRLAQSAHGAITAESGRGGRFRVQLPRA